MSPEQIVSLLIDTLQKYLLQSRSGHTQHSKIVTQTTCMSQMKDILKWLLRLSVQIRYKCVILVSTSRIDLSNTSKTRHIHLEGLTQESAVKYATNYGTSFPEDPENLPQTTI